ncbi:MAG: ribbon-helix-helix protein, CopG family [Acidobacteria bacterium]|nr:ribbon-helix-helix protein, CopG family [Acidobacteriota bacterium]
MKTISLKLPEDLLVALEAEAKARRESKSSLVRDSLRKSLANAKPTNSPSCYDLASDLAGSLKGLPRNLAHDPKFMKGFGE